MHIADDHGNATFVAVAEPRYSIDGSVSIAFIKKYNVLTSGQSLASQLLLVKFPEGSPYDTLHAYIRNALGPFFASAATDKPDGRKDKDRFGPVKRQLADLELALLNLKRDSDIPEIRFPADPRIEAYLAEVRTRMLHHRVVHVLAVTPPSPFPRRRE